MENIVISTDASSDLSKEIVEKYSIGVASFEYFVDEKEFSTQENKLSPKDFYEKMKKGADVKTSQINYQKAKNYLENILRTGKDVLHICFSSGLSGTFDNFEKASKELNSHYTNKVVVIDSLCASGGEGLLTILVAKKSKENISLSELEKYANEIKYQINHIFTVDDLKYLVKGGRIGRGSAKIANMLHIKPLLNVDGSGKLAVTNKIFSRKLAIKKMFEKMKNNFDTSYQDVLISHANCEQDAKSLALMIKNEYDINSQIVELDFLIGCHSGPGTLALFFVGDKRL